MIKRIFDLYLAAFLLILFSPFLCIFLCLVKLDSRGRGLIKLSRVGKRGKLFYIYKIRTMYPGTEKVTRVGRYLREYGLDEIPQLINVIRGEMSLVGPRPEIPQIVENYTEYQKQRLDALPGITGLWQISPFRNESIHQHLEYDLEYIRNVSLFLDLKIMFLTLLWLWIKLFNKKE